MFNHLNNLDNDEIEQLDDIETLDDDNDDTNKDITTSDNTTITFSNDDFNTDIQIDKEEKKEKKKITFKDIVRFSSSVLMYSVITVLGLVLLMVISTTVDKKINQSKGINKSPLFNAYVIISESMVPRINVYDAVVTMRVTEKNIKVNDIITFLSKDIETQGTPITHRVVGIVYENPKTKDKVVGYRTKGDHNNTQDFALIKPDEVLGKVYLKIPYIGYIQRFLTKPIGWILIIVLPCLFIIGNDVFKIVKTTKKSN